MSIGWNRCKITGVYLLAVVALAFVAVASGISEVSHVVDLLASIENIQLLIVLYTAGVQNHGKKILAESTEHTGHVKLGKTLHSVSLEHADYGNLDNMFDIQHGMADTAMN